MELEELKHAWDRSANEPSTIDTDIMEMIYLESNGPLAMLQKKIKYTLYLFPVGAILMGGSFVGAGISGQDPIMWLLFMALFFEWIIALLNYFSIKKLQQSQGNIRESLLKKTAMLKRRYKWDQVLYICCFSLMPVVIEFNIYFNHSGVGRIHPLIRIGWYLLIFSGLFIIRRHSYKTNYEKYLNGINDLLRQTD